MLFISQVSENVKVKSYYENIYVLSIQEIRQLNVLSGNDLKHNFARGKAFIYPDLVLCIRRKRRDGGGSLLQTKKI